MDLYEHICRRLNDLGITAKIDNDELYIRANEVDVKIRPEAEWEDAFSAYQKARSKSFDSSTLILTMNNSVEVPLIRLSLNVYRDPSYEFSDSKSNKVKIARASPEYSIAHFDSDDYKRYFDIFVLPRLERAPKMWRHVSSLFRSPVTADYLNSGRKTPANLHELAHGKIRSCLVSLAIETGDCLEIYKPSDKRRFNYTNDVEADNYIIPSASYDENIVNYYKVARSSPFPSQSFLAFYHVLEYYFLRVSEDALHHQLKALINKPSFRANIDGLDRIISTIRKQATQDDETEMLRKVLQRFVPEDEFIAFIQDVETKNGEKTYTKKRVIFGEPMEISIKEGHAISNASKVLKHVRNAIVHSSDRYKREECHLPLSDSEIVIAEFIPVVKFFAEKVIYGTAAA